MTRILGKLDPNLISLKSWWMERIFGWYLD